MERHRSHFRRMTPQPSLQWITRLTSSSVRKSGGRQKKLPLLQPPEHRGVFFFVCAFFSDHAGKNLIVFSPLALACACTYLWAPFNAAGRYDASRSAEALFHVGFAIKATFALVRVEFSQTSAGRRSKDLADSSARLHLEQPIQPRNIHFISGPQPLCRSGWLQTRRGTHFPHSPDEESLVERRGYTVLTCCRVAKSRWGNMLRCYKVS